LWIEEPTHPDDVLGHQELAALVSPVPIAIGEAVANRVLWKNFLQAGAAGIVQADCTRLAGISEYLAVTIMAKKFPVKVVPHVGDMGQIHQHLVLFNHIALDHEAQFLEYIPHLRKHFVHPAIVENGVYKTPQEPGCSTDLWMTHKPVSRAVIPKMHAPAISRQAARANDRASLPVTVDSFNDGDPDVNPRP
jgi:L-fuconate dehydratase